MEFLWNFCRITAFTTLGGSCYRCRLQQCQLCSCSHPPANSSTCLPILWGCRMTTKNESGMWSEVWSDGSWGRQGCMQMRLPSISKSCVSEISVPVCCLGNKKEMRTPMLETAVAWRCFCDIDSIRFQANKQLFGKAFLGCKPKLWGAECRSETVVSDVKSLQIGWICLGCGSCRPNYGFESSLKMWAEDCSKHFRVRKASSGKCDLLQNAMDERPTEGSSGEAAMRQESRALVKGGEMRQDVLRKNNM